MSCIFNDEQLIRISNLLGRSRKSPRFRNAQHFTPRTSSPRSRLSAISSREASVGPTFLGESPSGLHDSVEVGVIDRMGRGWGEVDLDHGRGEVRGRMEVAKEKTATEMRTLNYVENDTKMPRRRIGSQSIGSETELGENGFPIFKTLRQKPPREKFDYGSLYPLQSPYVVSAKTTLGECLSPNPHSIPCFSMTYAFSLCIHRLTFCSYSWNSEPIRCPRSESRSRSSWWQGR